MSFMSLKEKASISGVGETAYSRGSGKSVLALQLEPDHLARLPVV